MTSKSDSSHCPLVVAIESGALECVKFLVGKDRSFHSRGLPDPFFNVWIAALASRHEAAVDILQVLINKYKEYNGNSLPVYSIAMSLYGTDPADYSLLHLAAYFSSFSIVEFLVSTPDYSNVNESMGDDLTPLHCAIMSRHEGLLKMELLLSKGAGVNQTNRLGQTPLLLAIDAIRSTRNDKPLHQDRTLLVQVLLGYQGINIDKKGKYIAFSGQLKDGSPLLLAAKSGLWGIVCKLVDKSAQLTMNSTLGGEKARSLEGLELLQDPEAQEVYPQLLKKLRV